MAGRPQSYRSATGKALAVDLNVDTLTDTRNFTQQGVRSDDIGPNGTAITASMCWSVVSLRRG
jgi:hypothetical protein